MTEYILYRQHKRARTQLAVLRGVGELAELRPYELGEVMDGITVDDADAEAGSPQVGDMIARNPKNTDERWLVSAEYFANNYEPIRQE